MTKDENMARRAKAMEVLRGLSVDNAEISEAIAVALEDMQYVQEVHKYGSELNMMLAHKEQYDAERNKPDPEWEELKEYVKKLKEEKNG